MKKEAQAEKLRLKEEEAERKRKQKLEDEARRKAEPGDQDRVPTDLSRRSGAQAGACWVCAEKVVT